MAKLSLALALALLQAASAFHDCIQPKSRLRLPPNLRHLPLYRAGSVAGGPELPAGAAPANCSGGLCVGMHNGPHEGGPASYPVGNAANGFTGVSSTMTVPGMPEKIDGICYYIWTDIFFGDMGLGHMNQFVPQLILGNALDGSSGAPDYKPKWGEHKTWMFGAHYFFEINNQTTGQAEGKAAYGKLFPAKSGEKLFTSFTATPGATAADGPVWTLRMGAVDDPSRLSEVVVDAPYMGIGKTWPGKLKSSSWAEQNYTNLCVNSCWELYGAVDRAHLPSSGAEYDIQVVKPSAAAFPWMAQWDEDEGKGRTCASSKISESHNDTVQHVLWDIGMPPQKIST